MRAGWEPGPSWPNVKEKLAEGSSNRHDRAFPERVTHRTAVHHSTDGLTGASLGIRLRAGQGLSQWENDEVVVDFVDRLATHGHNGITKLDEVLES